MNREAVLETYPKGHRPFTQGEKNVVTNWGSGRSNWEVTDEEARLTLETGEVVRLYPVGEWSFAVVGDEFAWIDTLKRALDRAEKGSNEVPN